ncbi:hypothetical protein [Deinococcus soli (ex Cha et al. 2016)]|uniref:Uncharacterized protein n=2 Tax=Deinococcus soli (ex Cha et al. 2016) TaxID=1309411 RepID=A0ACC6KL60_9DEIO|nr:hypothetical protein [Deinococcus soli (ex Cha et al. 2016)]MDR6218743.1 hypothetical protein [Deinococcus soli (ex Cha et al. 2016)]MDR6328540.1 hypothetical protein [Deinococcus soli (ex Cha et al. 2016)]MDR6753151.1 hypothetical protein [Deinococcus soli (ex Cha et al. 2016)]
MLNTVLAVLGAVKLCVEQGVVGLGMTLAAVAAGLAIAGALKQLRMPMIWRVGVTLITYLAFTLVLVPLSLLGPNRQHFDLLLRLVNLICNVAVAWLLWAGWPPSWKRRAESLRRAASRFSRPVMGGGALRP